jgi:LuxR family maltose regulon positive regulatory protein
VTTVREATASLAEVPAPPSVPVTTGNLGGVRASELIPARGMGRRPIRPNPPAVFANTKFAPPALPATYVRRPALLDQLDQGRDRAVTLVVGLPASGKTTLLADWVGSRMNAPWVWLNCDERDADPALFWRALLRPLRLRWPELWTDSLDALDDDAPDFATVAIGAANDLARVGRELVVVVDDCQAAGPAMAGFGALLEHLPPNAHVVLAARSQVDLPLARMRAHGLLYEIRQDALSLEPAEVAQLLGRFGIALSPRSVATLTERTEGWMAGIQLSAHSLRCVADPERFIVDFAGSSRAVTEYLIEEVLAKQPDDLRQFLLETSILNSFDVELCAEVTGRSDAAILLGRIERENLFVVAVTDGRTWRYHELFADLLRYQLRIVDPQRERELHRIAAAVLARRGEIDQAVRHYLAAGEDEALLEFLRTRVTEAYFRDDGVTVQRCLDELDTGWAQGSLARLLEYAFVLGLAGRTEDGQRILERTAAAAAEASDERVVGRYHVLAALSAGVRGDGPAALRYAEKATALIDPAREPLLRWLSAFTLRAHLWGCDFNAARRIHAAGRQDSMPETGFADLILPAAASWLAMVEGNLHESEMLADGVLEGAVRLGLRRHPALSEAFRSKGWAHFERQQYGAAEPMLEESLANSERSRRPAYALISAVALARLWLSSGRIDDAAELAMRARRFLPATVESMLFELVDGLEGRLALARDDPERAAAVAARLMPSRRKAVLEARVAMARRDFEAAARLLADPRFPPVTRRQQIRDRVLRAQCSGQLGRPDAGPLLLEGVDLAEREDLLQCVLEDLNGMPAVVLGALTGRPGAFTQQIVSTADRSPALVTRAAGPARALPEPLRPQELKVLRYLGTRLTQGEIAADLYISINTMKTHVKAIYRKLDVGTRRDAVERGRHFGLT